MFSVLDYEQKNTPNAKLQSKSSRARGHDGTGGGSNQGVDFGGQDDRGHVAPGWVSGLGGGGMAILNRSPSGGVRPERLRRTKGWFP